MIPKTEVILLDIPLISSVEGLVSPTLMFLAVLFRGCMINMYAVYQYRSWLRALLTPMSVRI